MHVAHLTWEFPPMVYGGLGRHVHALATAQVAAGLDVTVVTQQPEGSPSYEHLDGVEVVRVPPDGPFPYHLPAMLTWVGHLDHAIGQAASRLTRVDIVHAHDWVVARAGAHASAALEVPLVATVHATEAGRHYGWLADPVARAVHLVEQWLVDEADEIIVCSKTMADEVVRAHRADAGRITVIPNGIDASRFQPPDRLPTDLMRGDPRITFVGRLEWEKGVFVAVAAMPAILAEYPAARLRMVGTGNQTDAVRAAIGEQGMGDHVELVGYLPEAQLRAAYSASDVIIVPSSYEPFGMVALEAAAMGAPLVVGDTGGLAEFVTDDRGLRHTPDDPLALAGAVLEALADPQATARRCAAARQALAPYSWPAIAAATDGVYRRAARRANPPRVLAAPPNPVWDQAG